MNVEISELLKFISDAQLPVGYMPVETPVEYTEVTQHPLIGTFCIVRCSDAGVHAGEVEEISGRSVLLKNSRRLWAWQVPMDAPDLLSGVSQAGLDYDGSEIGCTVERILLTENCEIIQCSKKAAASISEAPACKRTR